MGNEAGINMRYFKTQSDFIAVHVYVRVVIKSHHVRSIHPTKHIESPLFQILPNKLLA